VPGRRRRILLVEDHEVNRVVAREILERAGIAVDIATTGLEAIAARFARSYDAVLMDCQMPVMDGLEATRAIRAREATEPAPRVPIIAVTASDIEGHRDLCFRAGMDDHLSKPYTRRALLAAIDRWVGSGATPARDLGKTDAGGAAISGAAGPFDLDHLSELLAGDRETIADAIRLFARGAPAALAEIAALGQAGDAPGVCRLAHRLAGSSAMVGARRIAALSATLEWLAQAGDLSRLAELTGQLEEAVREAIDYAARL
jgi:CheY-like chemotaxis protein/HPt (histidine-containing phosphotransfer) domain-containing protein